MCGIAIPLYLMIIVQPADEPRGSMFLSKRRRKWRLTEKPFDRIPTRWRLVIAGLVGSGTGLLILTMWAPGSTGDKSSTTNQSVQSTSTVQLIGRMTRIQSFSYEKSPDYCERISCSTVTCSSIPESLDPGQIASDYIIHVFKVISTRINGIKLNLYTLVKSVNILTLMYNPPTFLSRSWAQCSDSDTVQTLVFNSCTFPNKTLKHNWLNASLPIDELTFSNCELADLRRGTFDSNIFANVKVLKIIKTKIRSLKKWIFQELSNLNQLHIVENMIDEAEYDLLQPIADSLEVLALEECFTDFRVLSNVTGGSSLPRIQIASIQRNTIGTLSSTMLNAIPNVVALYLGSSKIENCEVDAFKTMQSLQKLDLTNNSLKNLPARIFASLSDKSNVCLSIHDNPWDCTCQFEWIQDAIRTHPSIFYRVPRCQTPQVNANLDFLNAKFCNETDSTTLESSQKTTTSATTETETTQNHPIENDDDQLNYLSFICNSRGSTETGRVSGRKLLSTDQWKFPLRFQDVFVKPLDNGTVLVNLERLSTNVSLIWFRSPDEDLTVSSINCIRDVRGSYLLTNLERGRSYTVCLLEELDKSPSPFDCLATRTEPLPVTDTCLICVDKAIVVSVSITMIMIVSIVSVLSSFLVIRRNPSLLRGSKRIVMVQNRGVKALVLPRGPAKTKSDVEDNSVQKRFTDDQAGGKNAEADYLTPLEVGRCKADDLRWPGRKASGVSSQYSAGSYVSGVEPSPMELADWRKNGTVRSYSTFVENDEPETPPPLPPHRTQRQVIPSLSLSVDALQDNDSPTFHIDRRYIDRNKTVVQWID